LVQLTRRLQVPPVQVALPIELPRPRQVPITETHWLGVVPIAHPWAAALVWGVHADHVIEHMDVISRGWHPGDYRWLAIATLTRPDRTAPELQTAGPGVLVYGKVIGAVRIAGVVSESASRWALQGEATPGRPYLHWQIADRVALKDPIPWGSSDGGRIVPANRIVETAVRQAGARP
jgi:hypothetical protein